MRLNAQDAIEILNWFACAISVFGSTWGLYSWVKDLRWAYTNGVNVFLSLTAQINVLQSLLRVFCSLLLFALANIALLLENTTTGPRSLGEALFIMGFMLFTVALALMGVADKWYRARTRNEFFKLVNKNVRI